MKSISKISELANRLELKMAQIKAEPKQFEFDSLTDEEMAKENPLMLQKWLEEKLISKSRYDRFLAYRQSHPSPPPNTRTFMQEKKDGSKQEPWFKFAQDILEDLENKEPGNKEPMPATPNMDITSVYHTDHGITKDMLQWAVNEINPTSFFIETVELPANFPEIENSLYGPKSGDDPVPDERTHRVQRSPDRPMSRMIKAKKRKTRLLTIVGLPGADGIKIYTAYGGPSAEREPGDPSLQEEADIKAAEDFWAHHALASE